MLRLFVVLSLVAELAVLELHLVRDRHCIGWWQSSEAMAGTTSVGGAVPSYHSHGYIIPSPSAGCWGIDINRLRRLRMPSLAMALNLSL
jgi:hypothetical protein